MPDHRHGAAAGVSAGAVVVFSGFTTGGFAPMSQSVMYYHSFPIEVVLMLVMLVGSISFVLHAEVWKGRVAVFFRDLEIRTMVLCLRW